MASVHMISTIKDFVAMENHAVDIPWWDDLVTGVPKPIVNQGYIQVPNAPGLGVDLDEKLAENYPYERAYLPVNRKLDGTMHNW